MYNKEQHEYLLYDFNKSVNSTKEWKCHILRSKNQEKEKQSLVQDLREDSVFVVVDWAMKFFAAPISRKTERLVCQERNGLARQLCFIQ